MLLPKSTFPNQLEDHLAPIARLLTLHGYTLDPEQPHLSGERFLMAKGKLVLLGSNRDGVRVVIKSSAESVGQAEISQEKKCREVILAISFSTRSILFPKEFYYGYIEDYLFSITEFIPQENVFAAYPLTEQFFMMMNIFEMQEAFHARTFEHMRKTRRGVPFMYANDYVSNFKNFRTSISAIFPESGPTLEEAETILWKNTDLIELYCDYLSHTDLAPTNFRIHDKKTYLIDLSSMSFGNKYDGWARFQNWGLLHDPELEKVLDDYLRKDRGEEEYTVFRLMKIYKAGFLLNYYAKSLRKTEGDLHTLTRERLRLWNDILKALLVDKKIPSEVLDRYKKTRDALRSQEELERQKEFNLIKN